MANKIALTVIIFCIAILIGCNTLHGFGKDVKKAGEKIERSTDK